MEYAAKRGLKFREDPTNSEQKYLRNRVREKFNDTIPDYDVKLKIWQLWREQKELRRVLDEEVNKLLPQNEVYERAWFKSLDDAVALEILRAATMRAGVSTTRPQLKDFLVAIRTYNSGKQFNLPGDRLVKFTKTDFSL